MKSVRVRFAPSPTGHLHIGGARTALFNYLFARKNNGTFVLRIEDTDLQRSSVESEKVIVNDLRWLGINWDEGIDVGGEHGPYRSTERVGLYQEYVEKLLNEDKAYYCYCSEQELEAQRKELAAKGEMPRYLGNCRELTNQQREQFEKEGRKPVVRFKVPADETIIVKDMVRGDVHFESNGIGDFIIVKSDGIPVYNFAVVIDDYLMKITHVIRGEEHLSNTPRQILIYEALDFEVPEFAHVSLILGSDRTKMSKRHGSTWVEQYREAGYLPEAVINFLALLGWSSKTEQEIFTIQELEKLFSLDAVSKNPAVFDVDKLNWVNAQYIKKAPIERIVELSIAHLRQAGFINENINEPDRENLKKIMESIRDELSYIGETASKVEIFFNDDITPEDDEAAEVMKGEHVHKLIDIFGKKVKEADVIDEQFAVDIFKELRKETGLKGKELFMPIRVALTGKTHGPEMVEVIPILGKEKIHKRLFNIMRNV